MAHVEFLNRQNRAEVLTPQSDTEKAKCLFCRDNFSLVREIITGFFGIEETPTVSSRKGQRSEILTEE